MRTIPFADFPRAEQEALLALLRQLRVAPQVVCASRVEWHARGCPGAGFTAVTAPGLCGTYPAAAGLGWLHALGQDLQGRGERSVTCS